MHMPRADNEGHMRCKHLKVEVLGLYIRGIHHITMIHVIYMLIAQRRHFFTKWCIFNSYNMDTSVLAHLLHKVAKRPRDVNELSARASML